MSHLPRKYFSMAAGVDTLAKILHKLVIAISLAVREMYFLRKCSTIHNWRLNKMSNGGILSILKYFLHRTCIQYMSNKKGEVKTILCSGIHMPLYWKRSVEYGFAFFLILWVNTIELFYVFLKRWNFKIRNILYIYSTAIRI